MSKNRKLFRKRAKKTRHNKRNKRKVETYNMVSSITKPWFPKVKPSRVTLFEAIKDEIGHMFDSFIDGNNTEIINIQVVPLTFEVRKAIKKFYEVRHIQIKTEGIKERLLYPYKGQNYYVDLCFGAVHQTQSSSLLQNDDTQPINITSTSVKQEDKQGQEVAFETIVGQFARSLGYKLENDILYLRVVGTNEQEHFMPLTSLSANIIKTLKLEVDKSIFDSPEKFAQWILSSPRYDSQLFGLSEPNDKAAAENNQFAKQVYEILAAIEVEGEIGPTLCDLSKGPVDPDKVLVIEKSILNGRCVSKLRRFLKKNDKKELEVITGKTLKKLGYKPGMIYKKIMADVSAKFTVDDVHREVVKYVIDNYPLTVYGTEEIKGQLRLTDIMASTDEVDEDACDI